MQIIQIHIDKKKNQFGNNLFHTQKGTPKTKQSYKHISLGTMCFIYKEELGTEQS